MFPRCSFEIWIFVALLLAGAGQIRAQSGWQSRDIGTSTAGSTAVSGDSISISGSGRDIWNEADGFRYYYREVTGEFDLIARVRSLTNTHGWAKAAIMARRSIDPGSPHDMICVSVAHGTAFQSRLDTNGPSVSTTPSEDGGPPRWLRLTRRESPRGGLELNGYTSTDGITWAQAHSRFSFGPLLLGLAVTSHADGVLSTAQFEQVALTLPPSPPSAVHVTHRGPNGQIDLAWTDNSTNETGFVIEARRERLQYFEEIGEVGRNVTTFSARGLSPGWYYEIRVKSMNSASGAYSATILTRTTPQVFISVPSQTASSITVRIAENRLFIASPTGGPYAIERSTDNANYVQIASGLRRTGGDDSTAITDYEDRSVTPGTPYYYRARFLDTNGDAGAYATLSAPVTTSNTPPSGAPAAPSHLFASSVSASEVRLGWTDNATNETNFEIERGTDGMNFPHRVTVSANQTTYSDFGVAGGTTYYYRVRAVNAEGASAYSNMAHAITPSPPPTTWTSQDIGAAGVPGTTSESGGVITVRGSGRDIWDTADAFRFAHRTMTGDGEIVVRVTAVENTDSWAKAGVMMRASLDANAPNTFIYANPGFVTGWQYRTSTAGTTTPGPKYFGWAPAWMKLVRAGNVFTAHRSHDGNTWTTIGSVTIAMPATIYVGPAVTSHNNAALCSGVFDNVRLSGGSTPPEGPRVASFTIESSRQNGSETEATYRLVFSETVSGVDGSDFTVTNLGGIPALGAAPAVRSIAGSGATYAIVAFANYDSQSGGHFRLDLNGSGTGIVDTDGNALSSGATGPVHSTPGGPWPISQVNPPPSGTYTNSQTIDVNVDYGVTGMMVTGTPRIALTIGSTTRYATYVGMFPGSMGRVVMFRYTVQSGDADSDGIVINSPIDLNGATIRGGNGANGLLTFTPPNTTGVLVGGSTAPAWQSRDIGAVGQVGETTESGGTVTIRASGADIWNTADGFRFRYMSMTGDGEIVARVTGLTNTHGWAKAGVMFRAALDASSTHAFMCVSVAHGTAFQYRAVAGGESGSAPPSEAGGAPRWVRLVRSGNTFTGYESTNGTNWTQSGTLTLAMPSTIHVGLAVTSHNNAALCTATFDNITVRSGGSTPTPVVAAPTNLTATLTSGGVVSLAWSDNANNETVYHVERSTNGSAFAQWASLGANATSYNDGSATPGTTHSYRVRALAGSTPSAYSNVASVTVPGAPPTDWSFGDIGAVGVAGANSSSGNTIRISGSGADIWGTADAFRFVYRAVTGDGVVEAQVTQIEATDFWAKAGVMIRESLAPGARNAFACVTPAHHGVVAQARTATNGETTSAAGPLRNVPYWVRLRRTGTTFTASASPDGVTWTTYATFTIPMGATAYFGFAVTSHDNTRLNNSVFTDPFVQ